MSCQLDIVSKACLQELSACALASLWPLSPTLHPCFLPRNPLYHKASTLESMRAFLPNPQVRGLYVEAMCSNLLAIK